MDRAPDLDLNVTPVGERIGDGMIARAIGSGECVQGLIAENNTEPERVVRAVALDHRDVCVWTIPLEQDREIQACRTAADHRNAHMLLVPT